jgi:hypothetical protein
MGLPIATTQSGFICFAFPDVCRTPVGPSVVPIPYPNIGQLSGAQQVSDGSLGGAVNVAGHPVILARTSQIPTTTGDEAGTLLGVISNTVAGPGAFTRGSLTVHVNGKQVVRLGDQTGQNHSGPASNPVSNAVGIVLGGVPNVLAGG